jgi:hypothetical protein
VVAGIICWGIPAGPFSYFAQLTLLVGRGLIGGRDPEIENRAFHRKAPVENLYFSMDLTLHFSKGFSVQSGDESKGRSITTE